jgi:hypothetical protein
MTLIERLVSERRCGIERRSRLSPKKFWYKGPEKRLRKDRRLHEERRSGWVRINKWSSVYLSDLKIAKYLIP